MRFAINARWLAYPNCAHSLFLYNVWGLYESLIQHQSERVVKLVDGHVGSLATIASRIANNFLACGPISLQLMS